MEAPQYPYWEQHSDLAPSRTKPTQVKPELPPQVPSVEVFRAPVGAGAEDEVDEGAEDGVDEGAELGLALVPQLPKRVLQPVPQWSV